MDISEYRKQYAEQLEQGAEERKEYRASSDKSRSTAEGRTAIQRVVALSEQDEVAEAFGVIEDKTKDAELRASTLYGISIAVSTNEGLITKVLGLLKDNAEAAVVRRAALRVLKQLSFSSAIFKQKRPAYLAALREAIDTEDASLRDLALETLAQEKDEYVQRRLLEGLKDPSRALVPPAKAIQLLGYDIHAEHYPILKEIVEKPPSAGARQEAIRLLAADPSSTELLAGILRDKGESRKVRSISATALQSLAPSEFEEHARQIVTDESEDDVLRATCLSALTHFGDQEALSQDTELNKHVEGLQQRAPSKQVGRAAAKYLAEQSKESKEPSKDGA
jgi:hypothetical protein